MEKINIGIIGAGRIAEHHIKAIMNNKKFKICCISDLVLKKAKYYSGIYKIPFYGHYSDMLSNHKNLDLVSIITPSGMHYQHSKDILKKLKKILLLKNQLF